MPPRGKSASFFARYVKEKTVLQQKAVIRRMGNTVFGIGFVLP